MKQLFALLLLTSGLAAGQISPQFFAMHVNTTQDPWPTTVGLPFSSWRSLSGQVKWSDLNPSPGVYDWTQLDRWLSYTGKYGQSVLYNFYYTPSWASACPGCSCTSGHLASGGCYPPNDLNSDGSGTDQHLKDFLNALLAHVGRGKIGYIEVWNEPNIPAEYAGNIQQLVRMASDIRSIAKAFDPNIQIVSPPETGDGRGASQMKYLGSFLAAGGGADVDVIALHGYVLNPEDIVTRVNSTLSVMSQYGQTGKPVFITEGSWCCMNTPIASQLQPGFTFRQYLSILSTPVQRFYVFSFDSAAEGNLWPQNGNALTPNGAAYQLYYNWLVGASMTQPCQAQSASSSVWSCTFTRANGYEAEAIWDTAAVFPSTHMVTVPSQYVQYRDLYGHLYPISNHQVPVGYNPIWMEN